MNRQATYQVLIAIGILTVGYGIVSVTQTNLAELGVTSNIGFLWQRAGFEISQTLVPFDANSSFGRAFVVALLNTLMLAVVSIFGASLLGLLVGLSRLSNNWLVAWLGTVYVEIFRNIPSLLQIFFWYFVVIGGLPRVHDSLALFDCIFLNNRGLFLPWPVLGGAAPWNIGWEIPTLGRFSYEGGLVLLPEFLALVVGLSIYNATYIGEIVRSGFKSVAAGQTEAARALGLTGATTLRLVVFPQALRVIIPPLTTVYLNLFKGTSLAAAIAYPEIVSVFVGTVNNLVGQPVVIMTITLMVYVTVSLLIALFMNWYNHRIALTVAQ